MVPNPRILRTDAADADGVLCRVRSKSRIGYALFTLTASGNVVSWNAGAQAMFGFSEREIVGESIAVIYTPQDLQADVLGRERAAALGGREIDERWHLRKDGSTFWAAKTMTPLFDNDGGCIGFETLMLNMTNTHVAFKELSDREHNLRSVLDGVHDYAIVSLAPDGAVTSWNAGAQKVFGYTAHEMLGVNFAVLYSAQDVLIGAPAAELLAATVSGSTQSEMRLVRKDGTPFLASGKLRALERGSAGEVRGFVSVLSDITERAAAELDLQRRADFDELTQLPNRRIFYENVQAAIVSIRRRSTDLFAVLFVDIDHFKQLNDACGHIVADRLLCEIARRLERCVRAADTVARLGGDEFGLLIAGVRDITDAQDTAERIEAEMRQPLTIDGKDIAFSVSIGIALGKPGYERTEDILHDADTAMYDAKRLGRARSAVFRA